jgi:hypothetical protein
MEKKINIVEYLKDCPKGMELDCTTWDNVSFIKVVNGNSIYLRRNDKPSFDKTVVLNQYGCCTDYEDEKCRIFPKGKTSWEGFQRPFKDGDVVFYDNCVGIFKEWGDETLFRNYVKVDIDGRHPMLCDRPHSNGKNIKREARFATEEEKQKLFDCIKEKGYRWNTETKTLEKLIESKEDTDDKVVIPSIYFDREYYADEVELHLGNYEIEIRDGKTYAIFKNQETKTLKPKFKVGDRIKHSIVKMNNIYYIVGIKNLNYQVKKINGAESYHIPITNQDDWELVLN